MGLVAPLLATALALAAPAGPSGEHAFALLSNNRLIELALPSGKVVLRRRLGAGTRGRADPARMLAVSDTRLFALVREGRSPDSIAVVDRRSGRIHARHYLEAGVDYRGIVFAGDRLYAYGGRLGAEIDTTEHIHEESAVVTQLDAANGETTGTTTVRPARGHMWWIYWAAARADESLLALSYHGGCTPNFAQLCTSGADWIALRGQELNRCEGPTSSNLGCLERAHGMIEPYGVGWIATTGQEPLVQYGRDGRVLRELHTGIRRDHVMNFAFTPDRGGLYVISSCLYSHEGLRRVSLTSGTSRLVRGKICGESLAVGRTAILVRRTNAIELRRPGTARLRRQIRFGADVLDMIVAG